MDIQPAVSQRAGIGRYVAELVANLPPQEDIDFDLFYLDFKGKAVPPAAPGCNLKRFSLFPGRFIQQAWKRIGWPRFDSLSGAADLFHFTNFIIPPLSPASKAVVSIHDISFLLHPEFAETKNLDYLSDRIHDTAKRAEAIITISKQSADDIHERLNIPRERIFPIYLGVADEFKASGEDQVQATRKSLSLGKPYMLMVGTFEPRKNIPFAVKLLEEMSFFDGDLVIVGQKGWKNDSIFDVINASPCSERIKTFTALPDSQLVDLYSAAECLLMTSHYEGFGFPPVEAMACATPVLSSSGGSLKEVCGDAALVLDNYDMSDWLEKAQSILTDTELRADLVKKGLARAAEFTWKQTAIDHVDAYRKVLS
jgi:glycosyltransferase involved in cell wall biosynthesis